MSIADDNAWLRSAHRSEQIKANQRQIINIAYAGVIAMVFCTFALIGTQFYLRRVPAAEARATLCLAIQLRTCDDEALRMAFAADDRRMRDAEELAADLKQRLEALEAVTRAEGHFKAEPARGSK